MDYRTHRLPVSVLLWLVGFLLTPAVGFGQSAPPPGSPADVLRSGLAVDEDIRDQLNASIIRQLATYPVGSSSGGFTYSFDPGLGIVARSTRSFGPSFAERALTVGRGHWSVGFIYQRAKFDRFEGRDLTNLILTSGPDVEQTLALDLTADTAAFIAEIGLLPRLDVSVVVPFGHVRVSADAQTRDAAGVVLNHTMRAASASGVTDVVIKGKYNLLSRHGGGVAAAVDLRLPTGDRENLLGTGRTRVKMFGIASAEIGRLAPHVNLGFTTQSGQAFESRQSEFNYSGGVDVIVSPRLTVLTDFVGQTRSEALRFGDGFDPDSGTTFFTIVDNDASLSTALGSVGAKFNLTGNVLLTGSVLLPLNNAGLNARRCYVVGFDVAF